MYQIEIHIKNRIPPQWSDWFDGLQVQESEQHDTILRGEIPDMSAVYGIISRLSSLAITLISVQCIDLSDAYAMLDKVSEKEPST